MGRSVPALWLVPLQGGLQSHPDQLSGVEQDWAAALPLRRRLEFLRSRAWMRQLLAGLLRVDPLALPLEAPPGAPPRLAPGWGYVSLSHCADALLVGWSPVRIGVDLERRDRNVPAEALARRFFVEEECHSLQGLDPEGLREAVLSLWVIKEAAIKWQRGSVARDLSQWCCREDRRSVSHRTGRWELAVQGWQEGPWMLAMAQASPASEVDGPQRQVGMLCLA